MRRCGLFDDAMREERSVAHCVDFPLLLIDVQFPITIMVHTHVNKLMPMNFIMIAIYNNYSLYIWYSDLNDY